LFIFNMQLEMIPLLRDGSSLLRHCCWLAEVASELDVPVTLFEHRRLGDRPGSLAAVSANAARFEKATFDSLRDDGIREACLKSGRTQTVLAGSETHVNILPTALSFQSLRKEVFVVADAVSTRYAADHEYALMWLERAGVTLITQEMFFFQLLSSSEDPRYLPLARRFLDGRYLS
jgi:hypothetical protein